MKFPIEKKFCFLNILKDKIFGKKTVLLWIFDRSIIDQKSSFFWSDGKIVYAIRLLDFYSTRFTYVHSPTARAHNTETRAVKDSPVISLRNVLL